MAVVGVWDSSEGAIVFPYWALGVDADVCDALALFDVVSSLSAAWRGFVKTGHVEAVFQARAVIERDGGQGEVFTG